MERIVPIDGTNGFDGRLPTERLAIAIGDKIWVRDDDDSRDPSSFTFDAHERATMRGSYVRRVSRSISFEEQPLRAIEPRSMTMKCTESHGIYL